MPDYSKCVIYTIKTGDSLYVGSTCNFTKRKYDHKSNINNVNYKLYNCKLYKTIRDNGYEWDMKPYNLYPCETKMEMNIEEERIRKELNANLNMCKAYRTEEEKKEYMKNYNTLYYEENKDRIKDNVKNYRIKNKKKK